MENDDKKNHIVVNFRCVLFIVFFKDFFKCRSNLFVKILDFLL